MKLKTSAIALAVAGSIATPMAAQADLYASARIGIKSVDTGGDNNIEVAGVSSRFGMRTETDLGNGMTAFGRYEFGVATEGAAINISVPDDTLVPADANTDPDEVSSGGLNVTRRHAYVGLKGDFGSLTLGQTYHTFYNHVVGPADIPWVGSGIAMVSYTGRTSQAASYAGSAGAITYGLTAYFLEGGEEDLDGTELAATFPIGDMSLGVGFQDFEVNDDPTVGLLLSGIALGDASLQVGFQNNDNLDSILLHVDIGNIYVHYEGGMGDDGAFSSDQGEDPTLFAVGYTKSLGRKTTAWFEAHSIDNDTGDSDDDVTGLYATLKYDIE